MKRLYLLGLMLLFGLGCAADGTKGQWDEVWRDLRGDNMEMKSDGGAIGGWGTASAFGGNATNAYEGITQFIQALNQAYDAVIGNLGKTVTNYADAETTTASAATRNLAWAPTERGPRSAG